MTDNLKIKPKVLVADDQLDILRSAEMLLTAEGMEVTTCASPSEVLFYIQKQEFDVLLLDLNYQRDTTSGSEGLQLIKDIRAKSDSVAIVAMTAWASIDLAVEAMKIGAKDFVTKPWDVERLLSIILNQYRLSRSLAKQAKLQTENQILREENDDALMYQSPEMQQVMNMFSQISQSDASVLITGENGTGKSKLAYQCYKKSARYHQPFISVNMGGLADSIFESEMFGHQKGAFTGATTDRIGRFELADGGTLFLDEITNLSETHQSTVLRLLETGEFERLGSSKTRQANVRIIAATNSNVPALIEQGSFREDLFYRINTVPIHIPALRERTADIIPLARQFLSTLKTKYHKPALTLDNAAEQALLSYAWPGNVRELSHSIERAVLLTTGNSISEANLHLNGNVKVAPSHCATSIVTLAEMEVNALKSAIKRFGKQPDEIAKALGVSRSALYRKFAKYGLSS